MFSVNKIVTLIIAIIITTIITILRVFFKRGGRKFNGDQIDNVQEKAKELEEAKQQKQQQVMMMMTMLMMMMIFG